MAPKAPAVLDFAAQRSTLLSALAAATRVATSKIIPELGSMFITLEDKGAASWWATNHDIWRGGTIDVESSIQAGAALLPVGPTIALLKSCADGLVRLTFTGNSVQVVAGGLSARIPAPNMQLYPTRPTIPAGGLALPAVTFATIIGRVGSAVSAAHAVKNYEKGALFSLKNNVVLCVSTTGHHISKASAPFQHDAESDTILPKASLVELSYMLDGAKAAQYVKTDDGKHIFVVDGQVLVSRSIEDKFPNWMAMIPPKYATRIVGKRDEWLDVLNRIMVVSDIESRCVQFDIEKGHLTVSAKSLKGGDATERVTIDQQGPDVQCSVNGVYVRHFLETATSERVSWEVPEGRNRPYVFRPEDVAQEVGGADYVFIVAPMWPAS